MGDTVIVIDFETTGLYPDRGDRATEVAAVVVENGRVVTRFQSLMNAGVKVPPFVESLTGISNEMIRGAPPAADVMRELMRFVGDYSLIAHNASFDRKFLDAELGKIRLRRKQEFICSMRVARRVYPLAPSHSLASLVDYVELVVKRRHHRALADAEMTADLWAKMGSDLMKEYNLRHVPLELMQRLQAVPKRSVSDFLSRYAGSR